MLDSLVTVLLGTAAGSALLLALRAFARSRRPRPALPINCGDCYFMVPRNRYLHRETVEDPDGVVRYICTKRFIEVTPA